MNEQAARPATAGHSWPHFLRPVAAVVVRLGGQAGGPVHRLVRWQTDRPGAERQAMSGAAARWAAVGRHVQLRESDWGRRWSRRTERPATACLAAGSRITLMDAT